LLARTQCGVSTVGKPAGRHHRKCAAVMQCWKRPDQVPEVVRTFYAVGLDPWPVKAEHRPPIGTRPGDFVWRKWGKAIGADHLNSAAVLKQDTTLADLAASRRFIRFLRHVWLDSITAPEVKPEQQASLFRPAQFFRHPLEIEAFTAHMAAHR